jgi:type IV secretory pathway TraG/TraD family ATPase VirD4
MDTTLFLGGKEKTTLKDIAESLGKETIDLMNTSKSFGNQASHSQSNQRLGKDLMSIDEIAVMKGSKCILQVRGARPFLSDKYDITKHHNYKHLADFDPKQTFDYGEYKKVAHNSRQELEKGEAQKPNYDTIVVGEGEMDVIPFDEESSDIEARYDNYSEEEFNADMEEELSLP